MTKFLSAHGAAFTSEREDWTTPREFFDRLNSKYFFTLDAAASTSNNLCSNFYSIDNDAMKADWLKDSKNGWVWLNPPYGKKISSFMQKAHEEALRGTKIVALVPARTDTKWFQDYCLPHQITFIRGRLKFGNATNSAPFPSALIEMNQND